MKQCLLIFLTCTTLLALTWAVDEQPKDEIKPQVETKRLESSIFDEEDGEEAEAEDEPPEAEPYEPEDASDPQVDVLRADSVEQASKPMELKLSKQKITADALLVADVKNKNKQANRVKPNVNANKIMHSIISNASPQGVNLKVPSLQKPETKKQGSKSASSSVIDSKNLLSPPAANNTTQSKIKVSPNATNTATKAKNKVEKVQDSVKKGGTTASKASPGGNQKKSTENKNSSAEKRTQKEKKKQPKQSLISNARPANAT